MTVWQAALRAQGPNRQLAQDDPDPVRGTVVGERDRGAPPVSTCPSSSDDVTPRLIPCGFSTAIRYVAE